jgi:hypothetical protein
MTLHLEFKGNPDIPAFKRQLREVPEAQSGAGELLDVMIIDKMMANSRRRLVGVYLVLFGLVLMAVLPWAWSFASRAISRKGHVAASFLGYQFSPTPEFSLLLIVMLTAAVGSVAVLAMTFSARTGRETLERGFLWWYLTRPISAAGLGIVFFMAVVSGFLTEATTAGQPTLFSAAAIGGLAGLFTDQVLRKMYKALGLVDSSKPASESDSAGKVPGADSAGKVPEGDGTSGVDNVGNGASGGGRSRKVVPPR